MHELPYEKKKIVFRIFPLGFLVWEYVGGFVVLMSVAVKVDGVYRILHCDVSSSLFYFYILIEV